MGGEWHLNHIYSMNHAEVINASHSDSSAEIDYTHVWQIGVSWTQTWYVQYISINAHLYFHRHMHFDHLQCTTCTISIHMQGIERRVCTILVSESTHATWYKRQFSKTLWYLPSSLSPNLPFSLCSFEIVLNVLHDMRWGGKVSECPLPLGPDLCRDAVYDHALCPSHSATFLHLLQPLLDSLPSDGQVALLFLQKQLE